MIAEKQVALITGANKGIGLEIARQLGEKGVIVVLGSRDPIKGEVAAAALRGEGLDAHAVKLDVTQPDDIKALPEFFQKRFGRLDVLVNNAGVRLDHDGTTPEILRQTYEANVIGPFTVTETLLPLLKASPAGRIVNQSSILGSLAVLSDTKQVSTDWLTPAYTSSKTALNTLTVVYARQLEKDGIKVNAAHPGWVQTDMGGEGAPLSPAEGAKTAVTLATLDADGPTGGYFHDGERLPW